MSTQNKYAAFTATLVTGSTLAFANNIGFRGNCEIHEQEPACKHIGSDPLHTHHEVPYAYGTNTSGDGNLVTGTGTLNASGAIIEGGDVAAGTGTVGNLSAVGISASSGTADLRALQLPPGKQLYDLVPVSAYQQPVDEQVNLLMSTLA
jgi:hypothetical protein